VVHVAVPAAVAAVTAGVAVAAVRRVVLPRHGVSESIELLVRVPMMRRHCRLDDVGCRRRIVVGGRRGLLLFAAGDGRSDEEGEGGGPHSL